MAHEGARRLFLGIVDDVMGKTLLHYDAVPHEKHAVRLHHGREPSRA